MNQSDACGVSVRRSRSVRQGFTRPLLVQTLRTFPSFRQASDFVALRLNSRLNYRLAIQQTPAGAWAVCRVMRGGV
ncbi:hypothetical protein LNQ82_06665 [Conchiformibius steedae DSM 2580]|uniref:Uncharacterized protein n=1 Tax=Conchiformibius steedae DSM 2580 TaxID=1121352 RepID=A0AAE9HRS1_9NEIS|nr:hypothetical protein [Conchiformibius steedae]QMT34124.1 hypothetical protein H3L98_03745 [Conchiformibius steedae]URD66897.1 hypothetical protein LNQ82_06665 [Conchiformibius steedae DSM 2580]